MEVSIVMRRFRGKQDGNPTITTCPMDTRLNSHIRDRLIYWESVKISKKRREEFYSSSSSPVFAPWGGQRLARFNKTPEDLIEVGYRLIFEFADEEHTKRPMVM